MMYARKNKKLFYTDLREPISLPSNLNNIAVNSGVTIGHLKVDNNKINGSLESPQLIYNYLENWNDDTLLNAFFNEDLEAGNIKGRGDQIKKIIVKRLSPSSNYSKYETLGEIPYDISRKKFSFKDYFVRSGEVYLYTIQPLTINNQYGEIQNSQPGLNTYEHSWLIDMDGTQYEILNSAISNINVITKDGVLETIGGEKPFVNRFSNLDYRSFQITGTIASVGDFNNHMTKSLQSKVYTDRQDIRTLIEKKYLEKTGKLPTDLQNSMYNDLNLEREFREKVVKFLKDGRPKLFKSPTEGLMLVKLTNITLTPQPILNRNICDFSAEVTEIGKFDNEVMRQFNLKEVIEIE